LVACIEDGSDYVHIKILGCQFLIAVYFTLFNPGLFYSISCWTMGDNVWCEYMLCNWFLLLPVSFSEMAAITSHLVSGSGMWWGLGGCMLKWPLKYMRLPKKIIFFWQDLFVKHKFGDEKGQTGMA